MSRNRLVPFEEYDRALRKVLRKAYKEAGLPRKIAKPKKVRVGHKPTE